MSPLRPMPPLRSRWLLFLLLGIGTFLLMRMLSFYAGQWHRQMTYSEFYRLIQGNGATGQIPEAKRLDAGVEGRLKDGTGFSVYLPPRDEEVLKLLRANVSR